MVVECVWEHNGNDTLLYADNEALIFRKTNTSKNRVDYSESLLQAIEKAKKWRKNILLIHNHPNGLPPTADDCVPAVLHDCSLGVVCGHNGAVYTYKPADIVYTESECAKIHNAISLQMQVEDIDKLWLEMLRLYNLEVDERWGLWKTIKSVESLTIINTRF